MLRAMGSNAQVTLHNRRNEYIAGDLVRGEIHVNIFETSFTMSTVKIELKCVEAFETKWKQRKRHVHYKQAIDTVGTAIERCNGVLHRGKHAFPFEILLGEDVNQCPPTSYLDCLNGVIWVLRARFEGYDSTRSESDLCCEKVLYVYPSAPPLDMTAVVSRAKFEQSFGNLKVILDNEPNNSQLVILPSVIRIIIVPHNLVFVDVLDISLEKTFAYEFQGVKEAFITTKSLGHVRYQRTLRKKRGFLARHYAMPRHDPSTFKSLYVEVSYAIVVRVTGDYDVVARFPADVVSPAVWRSFRD